MSELGKKKKKKKTAMADEGAGGVGALHSRP